MAQIIQFPGTASAILEQVAAVSASAMAKRKPSLSLGFGVVRPIRARGRVPKQNRTEDQGTIATARLSRTYAEKAYALAQTEPDSKQHRTMLHMAGVDRKLPRNNLRLFTTPEDYIQGVWLAWHRAKASNLEWAMCDARRFIAATTNDEDGKAYWSERQDAADKQRWLNYERLIRIPAQRLADVTTYKLDRDLSRGMGSLEWMRKYKPDLAAVLDEELARFNSEKKAKKTTRIAAKEGR